MKLQPGDGGVQILFAPEEAGVLKQLVHQLILLLESHSSMPLDADPLFASLEIGGTEETPDDPALARLLPDAFSDPDDAAGFRRVTEQGLINRKLQDALRVIAELSISPSEVTVASEDDDYLNDGVSVAVNITAESLPTWARTVTALRLAMAARIGLEREADHDRLIDEEATRGTVLVYDWLAALLEAVLALGDAVDED